MFSPETIQIKVPKTQYCLTGSLLDERADQVALTIGLGLICQKQTGSCKHCISSGLKLSDVALLKSSWRPSDSMCKKISQRLEVYLPFTATVQKGCSLSSTLLDGFLSSLLTTLTMHPATAVQTVRRGNFSALSATLEPTNKTTGSFSELPWIPWLLLRLQRNTKLVQIFFFLS